MSDYRIEEVTEEQLAREREVQGGLAATTRELIDAVLRSTVPDDEMIEIRKELAAITERLRASQIPSSHGVTINPEGGTSRNYGNAVVGMRNPIAPPLDITWHEDGLVTTDFHLGAAYEGPPGLVHGGVSALLLDQVAGEAAAAGHKAGMTGTLSLRYERPTPLGELHAEAKVDRVEGIKTIVVGHISDSEGPTVRCEGIFIMPRWARENGEGKPSIFE
ncbi:acyl-coenzyme A thioesterase PaaI-like protein [Nocardioides daedukensis]|uniref:Acyl-coenzyme A thioesterase PaaI-like protein n=1 Tax=Nocardioides daedukensis TaxID=634462 RepID=A0A7Y9RZW7_9ACTN|nr:PaaI family thioesterase [Nocardioides daedukensis]NYG59706.1 acyl-coenzyme A thioesterase PaaI-like protein [Nocardioides daedukensis]